MSGHYDELPEPYYDEGGITIYHGDALDILPRLDPVDAVITDPPYNVGLAYGTHDDAQSEEAYALWCGLWFEQCRRLAPRIVVFPGFGKGNRRPATWWSIRTPSLMGCWYKPGNPAGGAVVNFCEWEPWLYWGPFLGGSDVLRATITAQPDTGDHPCPKPIRLMRELVIKTRATSVLDPFMGSGTTLRAAKDLGCRAVGIEIEERYCQIAVRRLGQEVLPFEAPARIVDLPLAEALL